jgi:hypothetical protein
MIASIKSFPPGVADKLKWYVYRLMIPEMARPFTWEKD